MSKTAFPDATRKDTFFLPPEALTIVTDPSHELFDERALEPVNEVLVADIMARGQLQPITVRKNGKTATGKDIIEVLIGRGRVKAITEVNRRLEKVGKPPMRVHFQHVTMSEEKEILAAIIAENEIRVPDSPTIKARKLYRLIQRGASEQEAATAFGISVPECKKLLKLMELCKEAATALDEGRLSLSAAAKMVGLNRGEQKKLLESIESAGGKVTAAHVEKATKGELGQAPQRMRKRAKVAECLEANVRDDEYGKGWSAALRWVLCLDEDVE